MKFSNGLAIIIASIIVEFTALPVHAQEIVIQQSVDSSFTFSECVSQMCVSNLAVFQENVEEYIPAHIEWADFGEYSGGGSNIPAHWETYDRARIVANVSFPSCSNQYHLEGYLTVNYRNGEGYITRTYSIERADENQTRDLGWTVKG